MQEKKQHKYLKTDVTFRIFDRGQFYVDAIIYNYSIVHTSLPLMFLGVYLLTFTYIFFFHNLGTCIQHRGRTRHMNWW